jgi:hypothetical protein
LTCDEYLRKCESLSLIPRDEDRLKVFENRVLRAIFGPKRKEVVGGWGTQHSIISVINSRKIRWAKHVTRIGDMRHTLFCLENLKGRDQ